MWLICLIGLLTADAPAAPPPRPVAGDYLVIVFHASWCLPCQALKVNMETEKVKQAIKDNKINRVMRLDIDVAVKSVVAYQVTEVPTTVLVKMVTADTAVIVRRSNRLLSVDELVEFVTVSVKD
mgnify:CR=1 FL=1